MAATTWVGGRGDRQTALKKYAELVLGTWERPNVAQDVGTWDPAFGESVEGSQIGDPSSAFKRLNIGCPCKLTEAYLVSRDTNPGNQQSKESSLNPLQSVSGNILVVSLPYHAAEVLQRRTHEGFVQELKNRGISIQTGSVRKPSVSRVRLQINVVRKVKPRFHQNAQTAHPKSPSQSYAID